MSIADNYMQVRDRVAEAAVKAKKRTPSSAPDVNSRFMILSPW